MSENYEARIVCPLKNSGMCVRADCVKFLDEHQPVMETSLCELSALTVGNLLIYNANPEGKLLDKKPTININSEYAEDLISVVARSFNMEFKEMRQGVADYLTGHNYKVDSGE